MTCFPADAAEDTATVNLTANTTPDAGTVVTEAVQIVVKRQAPSSCLLYRYGTFATALDIVREFWGWGDETPI